MKLKKKTITNAERVARCRASQRAKGLVYFSCLTTPAKKKLMQEILNKEFSTKLSRSESIILPRKKSIIHLVKKSIILNPAELARQERARLLFS